MLKGYSIELIVCLPIRIIVMCVFGTIKTLPTLLWWVVKRSIMVNLNQILPSAILWITNHIYDFKFIFFWKCLIFICCAWVLSRIFLCDHRNHPHTHFFKGLKVSGWMFFLYFYINRILCGALKLLFLILTLRDSFRLYLT